MEEAISSRAISQTELANRLKGIQKVVVAIHGIGSQTRSSTIRSVVRQFGDREEQKLPMMPLGFFHLGTEGEALISCLDVPQNSKLARIGFVEVFWADIPRGIVEKKDTLEETKAWGRTIVSRAEAIYLKGTRQGVTLLPADFALAGGIVDEIVETITVLENLCVLAEKAGIFEFDLAQILRDYVDDVQVVTEFAQFRKEIVFRFHQTMAHVAETLTKHQVDAPDIYIVAHSEGTVVSFFGLLEAIAESQIKNPSTDAQTSTPAFVKTDWIQYVRGYMTIGSPIDKHLVLWPGLWAHVKKKLKCDVVKGEVLSSSKRWTLPAPIKWRNYYDLGDPVGFELDTARTFLNEAECQAFEFTDKHDFGFSRYVLPGKAHNDYWQDAEVFGHFIDDVVDPAPARPPPKPPKDTFSARTIGPSIPYVLMFVLHAAAVYALYKGVSGFFPKESFSSSTVQLLALGVFFTAVTMAARVPRLTKAATARSSVVLIAAALAVGSVFVLESMASFVGEAVLPGNLEQQVDLPVAGRVAVLAVGVLIVLSGWLAPRKPRWGRRFLIGLGGILVLVIIAVGLGIDTDLIDPALRTSKTLWPAVLGAAGFLYLWWLGILIFDLAFVWHRYIRQSVAIKQLNKWRLPDPLKNAGATTGRKETTAA